MRTLDKIVETLLINGSLTEQSGLFFGKTGIAVFFFHYTQQTGNKLFEDYAMDLIEEVQKQLSSVKYPVRYDTGLAGIGCCFEYFLQNGFLKADDGEIFEEFDRRMYFTAMYEPYPDFSLEGGLTGWGRYFIHRINGSAHNNSKLHEALTHIAEEVSQKKLENTIPEDVQPDVFRFLYDLIRLPGYADRYGNLLKQCREWKTINEPDLLKIFPYMGYLQRLYTCQKYLNIDLSKEIGMEWENWKFPNNDSLVDMGLLKGWTNEGLLFLTSTNDTDLSWMDLL